MIHRAEHTDNYTIISNEVLSDSALSDGAKILLLYMLSCKDDWKFSTRGLASCLGLSLGSVNSRVQELKNRGYVTLSQGRGKRGHFGDCDWEIYEKPCSNLAVFGDTEFGGTEHGLTEHGKTERITNTNNKQVLNITSTKGKKKVFVPPTLEEVQDYCQSRNSDVDPQKFFEYYEAGGWKDAKGNSVKNWKQKLITWEGRQKRPRTGPIIQEEEDPFDQIIREERMKGVNQ